MSTEPTTATETDDPDEQAKTAAVYDEHKEAIDEIAEDDDAPASIRALARAVQRRAEGDDVE